MGDYCAHFNTDVAFTDLALLMIGTFQHTGRAGGGEHLQVDLHLSLPPTPPDGLLN